MPPSGSSRYHRVRAQRKENWVLLMLRGGCLGGVVVSLALCGLAFGLSEATSLGGCVTGCSVGTP